MWHDIKKEFPNIGDVVEVKIKTGMTYYAVFTEKDLNLYFDLQCGGIIINLDRVSCWRETQNILF